MVMLGPYSGPQGNGMSTFEPMLRLAAQQIEDLRSKSPVSEFSGGEAGNPSQAATTQSEYETQVSPRVFQVFFLVAGWSRLCLSQKPDARGSFALCDLHEFGEKCWSPFGMSHITLIGPLALAVSRSAGAASRR